jgi:hypothetical protein
MRNLKNIIPCGTTCPGARILVMAFVAVSIMLNSLMPRFSVNQKECDILSQILESQSCLLCFFSFSSIPLRIVGDLFANPQSTPQKAQKGKQKSDSTSTSSSDFSIFGFEHNLFKLEKQDTQPIVRVVGGTDSACLNNFVIQKTFLSYEMRSCAYIVALLFLFLLPRSGLPENAIKLYKNRITQIRNILDLGFLFVPTTAGAMWRTNVI